jgi:RNA polymerase sigma-70 factor (ECF subfamily)
MTTDEELMLEFQRGALDGFTELFHRYREPIYGFFRRRLPDAARAEELAQEVFLAILRGLERYEPRALFRTYLYSIALRQLAAERRKQAHKGKDPVKEADLAVAADPDAGLWVRTAIEKLEGGAREVLLLREYEQLSYADIGALLRIPVNTVRSRLFRARLALKEVLLPQRSTT